MHAINQNALWRPLSLISKAASISAALIVLALIIEFIISYFFPDKTQAFIPKTAMLTVISLGIAVITNSLSKKLQQSDQQRLQLENLIDYLINHLNSPLLFIDHHDHILMINPGAQQIFQADPHELYYLSDLNPELVAIYYDWQRQDTNNLHRMQLGPEAKEYIVEFIKLKNNETAGTLICFQDVAEEQNQAQNIKLTSLGNLTASIANQIQNPLTAIKKSCELLKYGYDFNQECRRLLEIIASNAQRMDKIIDDTLLFSKRNPGAGITIELNTWLADFINQSPNLDLANITLETDNNAELKIRFDQNHLQQVLNNLCENAIIFAHKTNAAAKIIIRTGGTAETSFIEIEDQGPGIDSNLQPYIFEAFFTTSASGSGLGLYIAKELCRLNNAELNYANNTSGNCFRINFSQAVASVPEASTTECDSSLGNNTAATL